MTFRSLIFVCKEWAVVRSNQRLFDAFTASELFDEYSDICHKQQRKKENGRWTDLDIDELFCNLDLLLAMKVNEIHGLCWLPWSNNISTSFYEFWKDKCPMQIWRNSQLLINMLSIKINKFLILLLQLIPIFKSLLSQDHFWLLMKVQSNYTIQGLF